MDSKNEGWLCKLLSCTEDYFKIRVFLSCIKYIKDYSIVTFVNLHKVEARYFTYPAKVVLFLHRLPS